MFVRLVVSELKSTYVRTHALTELRFIYMIDFIDQLQVTSSPFAAPFISLMENQQHIVGMKFQCKLLFLVHLVDTSSLKVVFFFRKLKR